ncbi:unnamed protein product [Choristocarpus tenellus]
MPIGDVVAAIDLGTSRTAYSYAVVGRKDIQLGVPDRADDAATLEKKTLTAVLLERSAKSPGGWRVSSFGNQTENELLQSADDRNQQPSLFKCFKMELYQGGREGFRRSSVDQPMLIATNNSTKLPMIYVVSLVLEHIKDQILARINLIDNHTLKASDIVWVLTIPAIWSSFGQTFMRAAAHRAGLIATEGDKKHLHLCLEPEAACLAVDHYHKDIEGWEHGVNLMVLDCGGGTIDITTHRVVRTQPLGLEELEEPVGGPWGSTRVDEKFKKFMKASGARFIDMLACDEAQWNNLNKSHSMLDLMQDWEGEKTDFQPGKKIFLSIGDILDDLEMSPEDYEKGRTRFNSGRAANVSLSHSFDRGAIGKGRKMILLPGLVEGFFKDVITNIVDIVKSQLQCQPQISVIYMVEGFSCSPLLQAAITKEFQRGCRKVVIKPRPGLAIVTGASLFGCNSQAIVSRKARLTYGTMMVGQFDTDNQDHLSRRGQCRTIDGKTYLDMFKALVQKGDTIPVGTDREASFYPTKEKQNSMIFEVVVSKEMQEAVRFIKDPGVEGKLCTLNSVSFPVDISVPFENRGASLQFTFGGTELGVKVVRKSDNHEVNANIEFVEDIDDTRYGATRALVS